MESNTVSSNPFQHIALSCSGGGYRAAAFHLGTMAYLNRLKYQGTPLLQHVKMISTVSGGTITGIVYAISQEKGQSFDDFYTFLLNQLQNFDLIKAGIQKLNPDAIWANPGKHKNLINAFAELYDAEFTKGATLGSLTMLNTHLETVVFNSTEFSYAIDFRFRNKQAGYSGNYYIQLDKNIAAEIKLADAMAASSCLTGGFEPIMWPQDFAHANSPNIDALIKLNKPAVGLMDGGIYDNQGIDAILNYKKKNPVPYFDLIIISDVASPYMAAYKPFPESAKEGIYKLTVKDVKTKSKSISKWLDAGLITLFFALAALPFAWCYQNNIYTGFSAGLAAGVLMIYIIKVIAVAKIKSGINWLTNMVLKLIPDYYKQELSHLDLDALSLHRVEPLVMDRLQSLVSLLLNVFLKVVRRLNYDILYTNENYKYRRISNLIKELTEVDFTSKNARELTNETPVIPPPAADALTDSDATKTATQTAPTPPLPPKLLTGIYSQDVGPKIKTVVEESSEFGTTLWFTDEDKTADMLPKLVATGQFTMCYNLLEYMEKVIYNTDSGFNLLDKNTQDSVLATYKLCKVDWAEFKNDPDFMLK